MKKILKSFEWAVNGIRTVWCEEVNFRIEIAVSVLVVALGLSLGFSILEWVIITGCIGAVLSAEILNTAIEDLCNRVEPNIDPIIGRVKDMMGGFVLVVSVVSVAIGLIILSGHL